MIYVKFMNNASRILYVYDVYDVYDVYVRWAMLTKKRSEQKAGKKVERAFNVIVHFVMLNLVGSMRLYGFSRSEKKKWKSERALRYK